MKEKIFRDPVHDYISVPVNICDDFIDTEVFQRLRHIEQTSIRILYPAASHDRFSHSLGVYHLGTIAIEKITTNCKKEMQALDNEEGLKKTFRMACLLHDCGHSPFSHSLENYYVSIGKIRKNELLRNILTKMIGNDEFSDDLKKVTPNPHEIVSAIVLYKVYKKQLEHHGAIPELAVRMILGCTYQSESFMDRKREIWNIFISLLNSVTFDVDKLDYIMRDTFVGGINNVSIDVYRLLSSLTIVDYDDKKRIAFNKSAISVIKSVIEGKTFLSTWVHNHHIVQYNTYLLQTALEKGIGLNILKEIFSINSLLEQRHKYYLVCDGDITRLLKERRTKCSQAHEFISREYKCVPLWKTSAELKDNFKDRLDKDVKYWLKKNHHPELMAELWSGQ